MVSKKTVDIEPVEDVSEVTETPLTPETVVVESVEAPVEDNDAQRRSEHTSCRAEHGDSYLRIAERYAPMGVNVRDYAQRLMDANGCKPITFGTKIILVKD